MAVRLGRREIPSSADLLCKEAERFLTKKGMVGAVVYRAEREGPGIFWLLLVTAQGKARYAIAAGEEPGKWELVNEGSGWPVV